MIDAVVDILMIEEWVSNMLPTVDQARQQKVRDKKAIHDPVLGTHVFEKHEIDLLNTPLLQRLRYLSQTGFVYLTFPGARHSRFEHTLGTAILVQRFARALNERHPQAIDSGTVAELRMAALLHDIGHSFFSHASETIYKHLDHFSNFRQKFDLPSKGAGEILSYGIVTSAPFKQYFKNLCETYGVEMDLKRIAQYIIGVPETLERAYVAEVISGPFDVDKLDYIHRDAHSMGLRLVVDLDRFFYAITIMESEGQRRLAIHSPEPLEQLIFSKMLLFSTVYHHHKVKACDCLLQGAVDWARSEGQRAYSSPAEFLAVNDMDFLSEIKNPLIKRLRNRDLLCRAASISLDTIDGWSKDDSPPGVYELRQVSKDPRSLADFNAAMYELLSPQAKLGVLPGEIWLDVPETPSLKELSLANIVRQGDAIAAESVFPTQGWLNAYGIYRSKGHVFAPRHVVQEVYACAQSLFKERFDLEFKTDQVRTACHW